MKPVVCLLTALLLSTACGRTEPVRYSSDGGELEDAGMDAGMDAGVVSCVPGVLTLTRATPQVMLVLDKSTSMNSRFSGSTTRWRALASALGTVLPPIDGTVALGALVFPEGNSQSCTVPGAPQLVPALNQVDALVSLVDRTVPAGHTPTADAIHTAAQQLLGTHAATNARALVVATDGAPNCNAALDPLTCTCASGGSRCTEGVLCLDDRRTVSEVATAFSQGVPTWVIGIQDGNAAAIETLNQMARAGGHPRQGAAQDYYAVTSQAALEDALTEIRNQVGACVYLTGSVPPEDRAIVIRVDGNEVPHDPTGADGWTWTNRDNGEIAITGLSCTFALANPFARLEAQVTCDVADGGS